MFSKISLETAALASLFLLLTIAVLLVPAWHSAPVVAFSSTSISLREYPTKIYRNQQACPTIHFHVPENILMEATTLRIFSQGTPLFFDRFDLPSRDFTRQACFSAEALSLGDNRVEVLAMGKSLFFHLQKVDQQKPPLPQTSIEGLSLSQDRVQFTVKNFDSSLAKPVELYVNGKLDHRIYPEKETQGFDERIEMKEGLNEVAVSFNGKTHNLQFEKPPFPSLPFPLGIALLAVSLLIFSCAVFSCKPFPESIALGMALAFILLITLVFTLNYLSLLSFYSVTACFAAIALLALFLFRKRFKQTFTKIKIASLSPLLCIAVALFLLAPVFFHLFTFTDITYWNRFYERQSGLILQSNSIPAWDSLSYFGRSYSFAPGYFLLEAGIGWVSGLRGTGLFSLMLVLSNAFLFFAIFSFGKALQLSQRKTALLALFIAMSGFLLSAMSYSPRHTFAFAFFMLALAFIIKHNNAPATGLLLAAMAFIQAPLLLFFPLFYLIVARKIHVKRLVKAMLFAIPLTLLFMLPNLLLYGLPFQANPEEWGYLINYSLYYWFIDIVAILVFFALFSLFDFLRSRENRNPYSLKLFLGFLLGTAIQLTVIYRWNVLTTTTLALLVVVLFPERALRDSITERLLSILALVTFGFLLFGMSYLNVHEIVTTPVSFIAENTSTGARVLSDPMFGHDVTSVAGRAVLADLRVEYADEQKLEDAYRFLETRDYTILSKYGITHTMNQVDYVHRQAIGGKPKYGIIEFPPLDKVYSNGFIFVHRVPTS